MIQCQVNGPRAEPVEICKDVGDWAPGGEM